MLTPALGRIVIRAVAVSALVLILPLMPHAGHTGAGQIVAADTSNVMDMAYPCGLTNPAFCDNFTENASTSGGREGALDPTKWDYTRFSANTNPSQGYLDPFVETDVQHCKTLDHNILPYNDSFFCGLEVPEPQHWMEAYNDGGSPVVTDGMIRQPFDFTNRTGTIQFGVDAKTDGSHTWWPEVVITDQPVPSPHDGSALFMHARNAVRFSFSGGVDCPGIVTPPANDTAGLGYNYLDSNSTNEYINYQQLGMTNSIGPSSSSCFKTAPDTTNMISIQLSTTQADIYASDAGTNVLKHVATYKFPQPLPFSVGYVHFEHAQYNASKEGVSSMQTYHWHDMGFDGPVHSPLRAYDLPDLQEQGTFTFSTNGQQQTGTGINIAYNLGTTGMADAEGNLLPPLTISNVNLTNAVSAAIDIGFYNNDTSTLLQYQINGGAWQSYANPDGQPAYSWHTLNIPVSLSSLHSGSNTITFRASNGASTAIANGDLSLNLVDNPYPAPPAPMIPCSLWQLMMMSMPNMIMVNGDDPCAGMGTPTPTTMPTGTAMPSSTATRVSATNTPIPPTNTPVSATSTPVPPSATAMNTPIGLSFTFNHASDGPSQIAPGAAEKFGTTITANGSLGNELVDFEVYNSAGAKIWQAWDSPVSFVAGKPTRFTSSWTLPAQQAAGTYTLKLGVFTSNWAFQAWDDNAATFTVMGSSSSAAASRVGTTSSHRSSSMSMKNGAQPRIMQHAARKARMPHKAQRLHKHPASHSHAKHGKALPRAHTTGHANA